MRSYIVAALITGVQFWLISSAAPAQDDPCKPCPRCQTNAQREAATRNVKNRPFDVHDVSGIWGRNGIALSNNVPPNDGSGQSQI